MDVRAFPRRRPLTLAPVRLKDGYRLFTSGRRDRLPAPGPNARATDPGICQKPHSSAVICVRTPGSIETLHPGTACAQRSA